MEPLTSRQAVAEEVLALMGRYRTTQTELATAMSGYLPKPISQPTLSRRLDLVQPFTLDELFAIALVFEVDLVTLLPTAAATGADQQSRREPGREAGSRCITSDVDAGAVFV